MSHEYGERRSLPSHYTLTTAWAFIFCSCLFDTQTLIFRVVERRSIISSISISELSSYAQWQRQRSKGARSFRGQKILQPGHPGALFSSKNRVNSLNYILRRLHLPSLDFGIKAFYLI